MITKIEKITLYVNSQDEAKAFWTEKMGFDVTFEQQMGPGMTWIEVSPKNAQTALVLYPKQLMQQQNPDMVAHPSVIFSSENIEGFHSQISANGVGVSPMQAMPWGKMFNFKDPDGNQYMVRG
jgi:predicted enzyme related to lactoylglutathione lyase